MTMGRDTKRLTLDVGTKFDALLMEQADSASTSKADIVRRAVITSAYLRNAATDGGKVSIVDPQGNVKELLLP